MTNIEYQYLAWLEEQVIEECPDMEPMPEEVEIASQHDAQRALIGAMDVENEELRRTVRRLGWTCIALTIGWIGWMVTAITLYVRLKS